MDLYSRCRSLAITVLHWLISARFQQHGHSIGDDSNIYAGMFQFFYLRRAIFFGCVGIFTNLFRGEMLEKTLHYYYLTPVRRELLVVGKYLAGLTVALAVFVTSAAAAFFFIGRHFGAAYNDFIFHGPGLAQLGWYALAAALACAGYGAVFLMCGLLYKNPMIPAAVVFVWENINPFLPSMLQKISVIYYLRSMLPGRDSGDRTFCRDGHRGRSDCRVDHYPRRAGGRRIGADLHRHYRPPGRN